ncbi:hypothetical protein [Actinomadura macrotermitis]|uniref:hypothetical protein n=1 Tax=Actinomadura macrotermitis TaxID=2585200 RepID=UPI0012970FBF|nr:hypothetical protein [Actinomadura macrotermitis]
MAPTILNAISGGRETYSSAFNSDYCEGLRLQMTLWMLPGYNLLKGMPFLVVVPAFVLWLATKRRAVGWTAVALLGTVAAAEPLLFGYDVARWGQICVQGWVPLNGRQFIWWAYNLLPVVLILAATYRPGTRMIRCVSATLATGLLILTSADQGRPQIKVTSRSDCQKARYAAPGEHETFIQAVSKLSQQERVLAYLCTRRGYPQETAFKDKEIADGDLLNQGKRACSGKPELRGPSPGEIAYLCPEAAAAQSPILKRSEAERKAENDREEAKTNAQCRRGVPPGPRPVRQATQAIFGGESGSYSLGMPEDSAPFNAALKDGLIAVVNGVVTVITGTQGSLCLTVRAYRTAPPPDLKGWDRVVEVGFDSPDGRSELASMDMPLTLPVVTAAGPGPYRLRLYVRGRGEPETSFPEPPAEHHLIEVFPGKSKKLKLWKNAEH